MKVMLEETHSTHKNFSWTQIRPNHVGKVLIFPFILWVMYICNYLDVVAFVHSQIFYGIAVVKRYSKDNDFIQISSFVLICILGSMLLKHQISGFNNYAVIETNVSNDGVPYSLWFNKDSIILGLSLIIVFYKPKSFSAKDFVRFVYATIIGTLLLISMALLLDLVRVDVKYVSFFGIWIVFNIAYVLVEEACFRLFLLESIIRLYKGRYNIIIASVVVSIIFALKHYFYGNVSYVFLTFIASLVYSYVYIYCGRRFEISSLCHLSVNIVHMLFFTYPFLSIS